MDMCILRCTERQTDWKNWFRGVSIISCNGHVSRSLRSTVKALSSARVFHKTNLTAICPGISIKTLLRTISRGLANIARRSLINYAINDVRLDDGQDDKHEQDTLLRTTRKSRFPLSAHYQWIECMGRRWNWIYLQLNPLNIQVLMHPVMSGDLMEIDLAVETDQRVTSNTSPPADTQYW